VVITSSPIASHATVTSTSSLCSQSATTHPDTLSLHDALPICLPPARRRFRHARRCLRTHRAAHDRRLLRPPLARPRLHREGGVEIGEHTSELQSRENLVCRLLLEKKKT